MESPSTIVRWPTRTPGTSVIAFHFPGVRMPGVTPSSRILGRSSEPATSARKAPRRSARLSLILLLILDLVLRRLAARSLQVMLDPLHHPEVVVQAVARASVAVPLAR